MFLEKLRTRNPRFVEAAITLHRQGQIPANCYVFDLDTVTRNARTIRAEADKHGQRVYAMTKQVGRNQAFCRALIDGGIDRTVAVDMECARACRRAGLRIGHLGHLVQVPRHEAAAAAAAIKPDYWTVFNRTKAEEAAQAAWHAGREQALLARIHAEGDTFYRGHEGGFAAADIVAEADAIDTLAGANFAGITTFPALLFDPGKGKVEPTPNLRTLEKAASALQKAGRTNIEINAPGTTSSVMLAALAEAGTTQCEPGHGLTGTTPLHAIADLPEGPAILYVTEVSHIHGGRAYCFGGGLYIDPVFPAYDVRALVSDTPTTRAGALASVEIPPPEAIDYYGMIDTSGTVRPKVGDTVVFGFRPQAFVTRAYTVGVSGIAGGVPAPGSIENGFGMKVAWPS